MLTAATSAPELPRFNTFLVRHGEGLHNVEGNGFIYEFGRDDLLGLTSKGLRQASDAAKTILANLVEIGNGEVRGQHVELLAAPSLRTRQTAYIMEYHLKKAGVEVTLVEGFGNREFHHVDGGTPLPNWDFDAFMDDPWIHSIMTEEGHPVLQNPYTLAAFGCAFFYGHMFHLEERAKVTEVRPTVVYVGNHFLLNMIRLYTYSAALRQKGQLKGDLLSMLSVNGNLLVESDRVYDNVMHPTVSEEAMVFHGYELTPHVKEYVSKARSLLQRALHLPIQNCEVVESTQELPAVKIPRYGYKSLWKENPIFNGFQELVYLDVAKQMIGPHKEQPQQPPRDETLDIDVPVEPSADDQPKQ